MVLGLALLTTGCSGPNLGSFADAPTTTVGDSTWLSVEADWNDVDAAVDVAASESEMAVLTRNAGPGWGGEGGDPVQRIFTLKTVGDDPVELEITRDKPSDNAASPSQLNLRAKVGVFGEPDREQQLLRALAHRLDQLKGVETCPVDR